MQNKFGPLCTKDYNIWSSNYQKLTNPDIENLKSKQNWE